MEPTEELQAFLKGFGQKLSQNGLIFFEDFAEILSLELSKEDRKNIISELVQHQFHSVDRGVEGSFLFKVKRGGSKVLIELDLGQKDQPAECLRFRKA